MKPHLQCAEQQVSRSNLTKYCACHEKWLDCFIVLTYETSFPMRGATGVTIQPHQILRLPRKMTLQDFKENLQKQVKLHFQCGVDPSMIRPWSEHDPSMKTQTANRGYFSSSPRAFSIEKYNVSRPILHSNLHQILRLPRKVPLELHQILRLPRKVTLELHQVLRLPRKVTLELHQVLRLPRKVTLELHQVLHLPRKVTLELHQVLYRPRKVTLELHQILRLSRRKTHILSPHRIWNVIYSARSNRCHHPTSPNTAPATKNDSTALSSSHMKRHFQCAEQQVSLSNLTKYCACHETWHCKISKKISKNRWNVISNAGSIRAWSDHDPSMIRAWKRKPQTAVTFRAHHEHFLLKNTTFRAQSYIQTFTKYCACHEKCHLNFTKYCACHEKWHLNFTKYCACHEKWHLNFTKYCACHEKWHLNFTKYCACHEKWHLNFTKYCACHCTVTELYCTLLYLTLLYLTLLYLTLFYLTLLYLTLVYLTYSTWLYSTWHYSTWLYSTWLYSTLLYLTLLYLTLFYLTLLYLTLFYLTLLYLTLFYLTLFHLTLVYLTYSTWLYSTWHYSTWHYSTWHYSTWLYSTCFYSTWLYSTWPTLLDATLLDTSLLDLLYLTLLYLTLLYLTLLYLTLFYLTLLYLTLLYLTLLYLTLLYLTLLYLTLLYLTLFYLTLLYLTLFHLTLLYLTLLYLTYSTWLYSTWHYSTWLYSTWLYSTWLYSTWLYSTWLYSTWLNFTEMSFVYRKFLNLNFLWLVHIQPSFSVTKWLFWKFFPWQPSSQVMNLSGWVHFEVPWPVDVCLWGCLCQSFAVGSTKRAPSSTLLQHRNWCCFWVCCLWEDLLGSLCFVESCSATSQRFNPNSAVFFHRPFLYILFGVLCNYAPWKNPSDTKGHIHYRKWSP